ncbi:signal transduction histidine kinase [Clostridium acetobutylicum]|uniref:histidine kinase n=1 Tax=Clostridium acetobutylicum (strain ATCC 824 / DSM 792 / JCM 1419 / IAM 19013 / LMG 5710 / NBRC 13948 / NRRL B-527 / VKM B-1787 / 2291 / W) TaxID=272562 RepID=Q97KQ4_CLOAB|nr:MULTISPECIES: HAMP domain-containing sensor histidine kinase [Clostridium]AAK78839.1 Sensory transduction histidine kinase [Clostridium acetobutylicum ATCC 824]ADZ19914.1 Sensory transduction histidine kinase [Clostridium acetobutylicum EA 2018]AEI34507.1 sensory transduction histidine kinase [Clostridium acetobutylicum DSM 1731]AWV80558.1 sensor histidine kinase [Clostridium acetobutylicum]MBC2392748.1 HAMP domain-containing histidine kinase [Clostridium acetobutylicum]
MIFLLFLLIIFSTGLLVRDYLVSKELKVMTEKLEHINRDNCDEKLKISLLNKKIEKLSKSINETLYAKSNCEAEKKKSENRLRQAISDMSHDLRTPLTAIKGYIKFLKEDNLENYQKRDYIEVIEKRAETLEVLLNDFYRLSLIDSPNFKLNIERINLSRTLEEVMFSRYVDFKSSGIEPKISICENLYIAADQSALERIIDNLITNSVRYAKSYIELELKIKEDTVILKISNNAMNLEGCTNENIFDRFYIADKTRSGNGTGLGLSIAKELTEKMGGQINANILNDKIDVCVKFMLLKS